MSAMPKLSDFLKGIQKDYAEEIEKARARAARRAAKQLALMNK